MKLVLALTLLLTTAATAGARANDSGAWTPTPEMVARLEAEVQTPTGAGDFHTALRVYWGETQKGRRVIIGQYHMRENSGSIRIVAADQSAPVVFDGGCSYVMVYYDPQADRVTQVGCNGVA